MTTPITPAYAPVQLCPDCLRPKHPTAGLGYVLSHCFAGTADGLAGCRGFTITRLRQDLATLQASHDSLVAELNSLPEHFSLIEFVDAGLPLAQASTALTVARRVLENAEASRAKGGG